MASSGWTQFQPWQNQPLPAGWEARYDANVRRYYFIDHSTHKTTWEDPRVKKPEAIPMSQFKASSNAGGSSNLLETSFGGSSSQSGASARQKTSPAKTKPAELALPSSFEYDDDFPSVSESFLAEMFKGKSEEDKENVKRKLTREFPDVDEVVIEVALRTAKHDESRARELIKKLKGDDDKKSEPSRTKKQEPSKAKGPTAKSSAASKSIEDVSKTKGKAPAKTKSSSQESLDKTKTSAPAAKAKSSSRESLDHLTKVAVVSMPAHPPPPPASSITLAGLISDTSAGGSSMSVSEMTGRSQQKPSVTQTKQIAQTKIYAGRGKAFKSSLLCAPNGSNPANAKGPNPMLLLPEWVQPEGPQRQNRKGPVRSNRQGPARRTQNCGPQASNRTGPVPNMAKGSIYGQSPLASYV